MQTHQLKHKLRKAKRIGRGGKRGTYSGRGMKGQRARAGHKIRPAIRDLIIRLPKLRGYKFKSIQVKPLVVNLTAIEKVYKAGEAVTISSLKAKGLVRTQKSKSRGRVKILGRAGLTKALSFSGGLEFSASAKTAIEKSGSTIEGPAQRKPAK